MSTIPEGEAIGISVPSILDLQLKGLLTLCKLATQFGSPFDTTRDMCLRDLNDRDLAMMVTDTWRMKLDRSHRTQVVLHLFRKLDREADCLTVPKNKCTTAYQDKSQQTNFPQH